MEFTLAKARKLYDKLRDKKSNYAHSSAGVLYASVTKIEPSQVAEFQESVAKQIANKLEDANIRRQLLFDTTALKNALFDANYKYGISQLMNKRDVLKTLLKDAEGILAEISDESVLESPSKITAEMITSAKGTSTYRSANIDVCIFNKEEIAKEVEDLLGQLNEIEDTLAQLNATKKIKVELSPVSLRLLGLKVPV